MIKKNKPNIVICPHCGKPVGQPENSVSGLCMFCHKPLDPRDGDISFDSKRFIVRFLVTATLLFVLLLFLNRSFGGMSFTQDPGPFLYQAIMVLFVSSALASGRYLKKFKYLGIWFVIIITMVGIYSFHSELSVIKDKVLAELVPSLGLTSTPDSISFPAADNGHFYIRAKVNDVPLLFLADTGASHIVLTPSDARKIGIDPETLTYDRFYSTANGTVRGSSIRLDSLSVGSFRFEDIRASVNEAPMSESLLGMTFFKKLDRYEVKNNMLTLYIMPRE